MVAFSSASRAPAVNVDRAEKDFVWTFPTPRTGRTLASVDKRCQENSELVSLLKLRFPAIEHVFRRVRLPVLKKFPGRHLGPAITGSIGEKQGSKL